MATSQRNGSEREGAGVPYPGIALVVAILVSAILVHELPLQPSRPTITEQPKYHNLAVEDVPARLWQDPFTAVDKHREEEKKEISDPSRSATARFPPDHHIDKSLAQRIAEKAKESPSRKILVLGVMMSGGPYPELVEERRQSRYAVLSGLGVSGFVPEDAEHIGYFQTSLVLDSERDKYQADSQLYKTLLPYEWLSPDERTKTSNSPGTSSHILLLWLDDDVFGTAERPLARIAQLRNMLIQERGLIECASPTNTKNSTRPCLEFKIIGPAGSTNLNAMIDELGGNNAKELQQDLRTVEFYSSRATAADELLLEGNDSRTVSEFFRQHEIQLFRTIGSDRQLARQLVKELQLRGVDVACNPRDHVLLISEWDTFYGRALPQIMSRTVEEEERRAHTERSCDKAPKIHRFSYLRGLDGQVPGGSGANGTARDNTNQKNTSGEKTEPQPLEPAFGQSQFDYLRRSADRIGQLNRELQRTNSGEITAVGVLGNDVYDKLLVLQALRPSLPRAIFFTTDLDARLWDPKEWQWTRNLLVASGFGPALTPELQREIPPFRSTYQTSAFLATLLALHDVQKKDATTLKKTEISKWLQPKMYEVARSGPFELPTETAKHDDLCLDGLSCVQNIDPPTPKLYPDLGPPVMVFSVVASVLAIGLLYFSSWTLRDWGWRLWILLGATVLLLGIGVGTVWYCDGYNAEPFVLLEGISIWPSILLRLLAGILAIAFLIQMHRDSDKTVTTIRFFPEQKPEEFRLAPLLPRILSRRHASAHLTNVKKIWNKEISLYTWRSPLAETGNKRVDAIRLWREYNYRSALSRRILRILPPFLLYLLFAVAVMNAFGFPHIPYRGAMSLRLHWVVLLSSVLLFVWLLFYIVDSIRLCTRWIVQLSKDPTEWPEATLQEHRDRLRLPPECLAEWLDIQIIRERTERVAKRIYYPFIILLIMVSGWNPWFDNWQVPLGLAVIITVITLYALSCAVILRNAAEKSRTAAIEQLTPQLIRAQGDGNKDLAEQIETVIGEIRELRDGAYAPYAQQPFVRAVLYLLGGTGGLAVLQYLALANL